MISDSDIRCPHASQFVPGISDVTAVASETVDFVPTVPSAAPSMREVEHQYSLFPRIALDTARASCLKKSRKQVHVAFESPAFESAAAPSAQEVEPNLACIAAHTEKTPRRLRFNFEVAFWFPAPEQILISGYGGMEHVGFRSPLPHGDSSPPALPADVERTYVGSVWESLGSSAPRTISLHDCIPVSSYVPWSGLEHVGFRSPAIPAAYPGPSVQHWPKAPSRHVSVVHAADRTCRATSSWLVRIGASRGRTNSGKAALVSTAVENKGPDFFTSFDLLAGASVYDRQPEWDADACVRRAITASHVPSPVGRRIIHYVPGWPAPQAIVTSGHRYRTHVSCVLVFQSEPHVPITVEALPWETPADLVRFAPPHLGLSGATACTVNGYAGQCDQRIPPDADWIELRVAALTANEARRCIAAWGALPRSDPPFVPLSWTRAGYFPRHAFPVREFPNLAGVFEAPPENDEVDSEQQANLGLQVTPLQDHEGPAIAASDAHAPAPMPQDGSVTATEDYFSSSHSGGLVCNQLNFPYRPQHPPGSTRHRPSPPDMSIDRELYDTEAAHSWTQVRTARPANPVIPVVQRRWNRLDQDREFQLTEQPEEAVEITIFDPVMHARVILELDPELADDPVRAALSR